MRREIEFIEIRHLNGPNMWTYRPVLEALIDIHDLEDFPSNTIPGFADRLSLWLPSLVEHRCSYEERGGFLRRLQEGTWPAHILEHVSLELQNLAGMPGGFGRAREVSKRGVYKVVVRAWHEAVTRAALHAARELILCAMEDRPYDVGSAVETLRDLADDEFLGPSTASIVEAADDRQIPTIRLTSGNLVQLGYGKASRRIWTAETDLTGAIAETISRDKELTKELLSACGLPVPEGKEVRSALEAWRAAEQIGLPVVVKPTDANRGRGVFIGLSTAEEVAAAYAIAVEKGSGVLVERCVAGSEHRLLVIGNRMVAATRGDTVYVNGDGRSTIAELIETQVNCDQRRGDTEEYPLSRITFNAALRMELSRQSCSAESVPSENQRILIQRNGNHATDVTDLVHPETAQMATLAARIIGLDIAGIDIVAEDIGRTLAEQGGAIIEVNAGPGLLMHLKPAQGSPRPVGRAIVDHLFPSEASGRIPIVGISGTRGRTDIALIVGHILSISGRNVGLACGAGLFYDRRLLKKGDAANWASGRRMLLNRSVEAAVIESSPRTIVTEGLPYDRCSIGVLTDLDETEAPADLYIEGREALFRVLRTQIDVVLRGGAAILNADDPQIVEMASLSDGAVIFYSVDPESSVVVKHRSAGSDAVVLRDGEIVLYSGSDERPLLPVNQIPFLAGSHASLLHAALASVATGHALGLGSDLICAGLKTFSLNG